MRSRKGLRKLGSGLEILESRTMLHAGPHADLDIFIDGELIDIPEQIGIDGTGALTGLVSTEAGAPAGELHLDPDSSVTLDDFFDLWRENAGVAGNNPDSFFDENQLLNRTVDANNSLQMFVNGQRNTEFEQYQINDGDQIVLVLGPDPVVALNTNFGTILLELYANETGHHPATPITVDNFLNYVNDGDYTDAIFHRLVPNFVLQGGGFTASSTTAADAQFGSVPTDPQIQNEFVNFVKASGNNAVVTQNNAVIDLGEEVDLSQVAVGDRIRLFGREDGLGTAGSATEAEGFDIVSIDDVNNTVTVAQVPSDAAPTPVQWQIFSPVNIRGTVAMAKLGSSPNSATSQPFVNLVDTSLNLDFQNGGFTVFAQVLNMDVVDNIATFGRSNLVSQSGNGALTDVPVSGGELVVIESVGGNSTIRGTVFHDVNNDDVFNSGDIVLAGATVFVDENDNGLLDDGEQSTTSAADGTYFLHVVSGTHIVRQIPPAEFSQTTPLDPNSHTVVVEIGRETTDIDFGNQRSTIRGVVFSDLNGNDVFDGNDTGIAGVTVFLDANNNGTLDDGEQSTFTASDGSYGFRTADGTHIVRQVPFENFTQTFPVNPTSQTVDVNSGSEVTDVDFANVSARISGTVFRDNNDDGVFNDGDLPLEGETVFVDANDNGALDAGERSATTGSDGSYLLNVGGGTHTIRLVTPNGLMQTSPLNPDSHTIVIDNGNESAGNDFANTQNSISGFVYVDANDDGVRDANEAPIAGVTITLTGTDNNGNLVSRATATGADGSYSFSNVSAGTYQVTEQHPQFMIDGKDTIGTQGGDDSVNDQFTVTLTNTTEGTENNFGEIGRTAQFARLQDYIMRVDEVPNMLQRFDDSILVAVSPTEGQIWSSLGTGWDGFVGVNSTQSADGQTITLRVLDSNAQQLFTDLSINDRRVTNLGAVDGITVLRLEGDSSQFSLQVDTSGESTTPVPDDVFSILENSAAGTFVGQVAANGQTAPIIYEIDDPTVADEVKLNADDHFSGNPAASAVLIEYLDFQ